MEIGRQSVAWHPKITSVCSCRVSHQNPLSGSLTSHQYFSRFFMAHTVIQSLITLLFIKVTELFGIQSKKCFALHFLLIDRLLQEQAATQCPPDVCPHLNCDQTATVSSMMVCWVGDTSPWPGVTSTRGSSSRMQERGDMAAY